jgi:hypothetical protein
MLKRLFHKEFLLFIALTSTIWLLTTVSNAKRFANVSVMVCSPSSIIGDRFLIDTALTLNLEVSATGINALRLSEVDGEEVVLESSSFLKKGDQTYAVKSTEVSSALKSIFGNNYNFSIASSELLFPCEALLSSKLPVRISGRNKIELPEGFKWLEPIKLQPDSVEVVGSADAVRKADLFVELPEFYWDGGHALDLPILGLSKDLSTVEIDRVEVIGLSELWSEKKVSVPLILGQQIVQVEVWISGPVRSMLNSDILELIDVTYSTHERFYSISCQSLTRDVSVLSVQPNVIEKLN